MRAAGLLGVPEDWPRHTSDREKTQIPHGQTGGEGVHLACDGVVDSLRRAPAVGVHTCTGVPRVRVVARVQIQWRQLLTCSPPPHTAELQRSACEAAADGAKGAGSEPGGGRAASMQSYAKALC